MDVRLPSQVSYVYDLELPSGEKHKGINVDYNMNNPPAGWTFRVVGGDSGERPLKPGTKIEESKDGGTTWNLDCIIKALLFSPGVLSSIAS